MSEERISRRALLLGAAGALGAVAVGHAQEKPDPSTVPGEPSGELGTRSPYETPRLAPVAVVTGSGYTPLQDLTGTITPADLHFQRHHNGIPAIDPRKHRLIIHGMVDRQSRGSVSRRRGQAAFRAGAVGVTPARHPAARCVPGAAADSRSTRKAPGTCTRSRTSGRTSMSCRA